MSISQSIKTFLPKVALSVLVFTVFCTIAYAYKNSNKTDNDKRLVQHEIKLIAYYAILIVGAMCAIVPLGIQPATLLAVFGTTGIAIALSMQGVLTNMVSGVYISVNDLFKLGDTLEVVDSSGNHYKGTVTSFNLFNTIINTDKDTTVTVPNTYIQNNMITIFQEK
jgi:small conductance mechanosensitive channel